MKKMKLVIMTLIAVIVVSSTSLSANFRTISHDGWNFRQSLQFGMKEYNSKVVTKKDGDPVRFGKKSEKFEVRPGDCGSSVNGNWNDCENDRERSEMTSLESTKFNNGDEYWYRWSIFFPKDYDALHPMHMTFGQFMQVRCKKPIFSFNTKEASRYDPKFGLYMTSKYAEDQNVMRYPTIKQR